MFPLAFGLVPEAYKKSVGEYIKSRGMACSVYGAQPGNIIPRQLWGIQPKTPGYGVATIRPALGGLKKTTIKVPTLRGPILGEYQWMGNRKQVYTIDIPANMVAEFSLKLKDNQALSLNGEKVNLAFGYVQLLPGKNVLEVNVNSF